MLVKSVLKRCRRDVLLGLDRFLVILFRIRSGPVALLFDFGMTLSSSSGVKASFRGSVVRDRILFLIATSKCLLSAERAWPVAEPWDPFPTMFLTKAHIFCWSFGPRLAMKADHAFFLVLMMVLLFLASAFLHSSRFVVDFGESLHSLKARLAPLPLSYILRPTTGELGLNTILCSLGWFS